jgi:carbon storage regulator CsrA
MLVLARRVDEAVYIIDENTGDVAVVRVCNIERRITRLGFEAPDHFTIVREEHMRDDQKELYRRMLANQEKGKRSSRK